MTEMEADLKELIAAARNFIDEFRTLDEAAGTFWIGEEHALTMSALVRELEHKYLPDDEKRAEITRFFLYDTEDDLK